MPTYEYECSHCGHRFEQFQNMNEKPMKCCPMCRHKVDRLVGKGAGFIFKGSGFHQTDYRSESYKKTERAEKFADGGKKKVGEAATESKADGGRKDKSSPQSKAESKSDKV